QNSFEYDDGTRFHMGDLGPARVGLIVVDRLLYRLPGPEGFDVIDQQVYIEGVRVIEVDSVPQLDRHIAEVAIIGILLQIDNVRSADRLYNPMSNGCLPRSRPTGNSDHHRLNRSPPSLVRFQLVTWASDTISFDISPWRRADSLAPDCRPISITCWWLISLWVSPAATLVIQEMARILRPQ